jgi:hypothetical protein
MIPKYFSFLATVIVFPLLLNAQKITYTEPDKDDVRSVDFDIIGKIGSNYLVYKKVHNNDYSIGVYDNNMQLVNKMKMDFLPDKIINSDIITYHDYFYFIYQYQKRNVVYCSAVRINGQGKLEADPVALDTTTINFFASNKIYNVLYSEDKQRIGIYKVNNKDESRYIFTSCIFDNLLNRLSKETTMIPMRPNADFLTEFALDNDGWIGFVKEAGNVNSESTVQELSLMVKQPGVDTLASYPIAIPNIYLDNIRVKVDNANKHFVIVAFYAKQKRGNIDGLFSILWKRNADSALTSKVFEFNDQLKSNAKSEGSTRAAFDDFFLQNVVVRKDGGFVALSESVYSSSHGVYNNRYDYYSNPNFNNSNYYLYNNPFGSGYYYPWVNPYGYNYPQLTRYYADNIAIMAFDSSANMQWTTIVQKSQYDDNSDNFIGYGIYVSSGQVDFLFNQFSKRTLLLQSESLDITGKIKEAPTLKELDKGYQFMPRYMKQVSSREVLIPCQYRNYLCFAKLEF